MYDYINETKESVRSLRIVIDDLTGMNCFVARYTHEATGPRDRFADAIARSGLSDPSIELVALVSDS